MAIFSHFCFLNNAQSETRNIVSSFWSNLSVLVKKCKIRAFSVLLKNTHIFDQIGVFKKTFQTRKFTFKLLKNTAW